MKYILILSLLFPLSLMAMEQDKETYCGIVTQLINSVPLANNCSHLSPISENTLVYKKIIPTGSSAPLMEFITSIDDLNPPQTSRFINTSATQYNVYINNVTFSRLRGEPNIEFTTTQSVNGAIPTVIMQRSVQILLGGTSDSCMLSGTAYPLREATLSRDNDSRLLKPSWRLNDGDIESTSRREDLEKCPSRVVYLMISYLRMNKISTESGDAYILSEKQGIE